MKKSTQQSLVSMLIGSFWGFLAGGRYQKESEARLYMFQGKNHYFARKWEMAWKKFILAESILKNDPEVQFFLSHVYYQMNRYDYVMEHIKKFEKIVDARKALFEEEIFLLSININILIGNKNKSIEMLKAIIKEKDQISENKGKDHSSEKNKLIKYISNKNLGDIYLNEKKYEEALEHYNKALQVEDDSEIYYRKGILEFSRQGFKKAVEELSKAIDKGYYSEEVYFRRAYAFFKEKDFKSAKDDFFQVVKKYPHGNYHSSAISFLGTIRSFN